MIVVIGFGLALIIVAIYTAIKMFSITTNVVNEIANLASRRKEMDEKKWKGRIDECTQTMWEAKLMLIICGGIFCLGLNFLFAFVK